MKVSSKEDLKQVKDYFVGLDIGTSSVGWAVTNELYEVLRAKGHRMWGSRLFEEGQTAAERRNYRAGRRRLDRRNDRLAILEELFASEIYKVDPAFYQRLHESQYHHEDKNTDGQYFLFNDVDYTDKTYHKEYPTIYHLRSSLMKEPAKDIRLLFLAVHHIIKYRGNFLLEGEPIKTSGGVMDILHQVLSCMEFSRLHDQIDEQVFVDLLTSTGRTCSDIAKLVSDSIADKGLKKQAKAFTSLVLGLKGNLDELFNEPEYKELDADVRSVEFSGKDYWEEREKYESILGESILALDGCKALYDSRLLSTIKPDGKYLSEAKVEVFNEHQEHLVKLKKLLKGEKALYNSVFRDDTKDSANYIAYIGKSQSGKNCSREDFYKFLKKVLEVLPESILKSEILQLIDLDVFLPLLRVRENGVIHYQIHEEELEQILAVASKKYEFLNSCDESGFTVAKKILKLLTFRIPYFVGPLNPAHKDSNGFAWVVRKEAGKVYPWDFEKKVDINASAQAFIENLTNKCTYLIGEDVLPKYSLAYSKFMLLNELNNLKYNGHPLSYEVKMAFITECFQAEHKKMTEKAIKSFLKLKGFTDGTGELTGLDIDIKSDLKSYRDMVRILGEGFDEQLAERIIRYVTLFGDAKKILADVLKKEFKDTISEVQVKQIQKLKYKEWGRLSEAFLKKIVGVAGDGPECNILTCMETQSLTLMEVLSSHNSYLAAIEEFNAKRTEVVERGSYDLVDELYISPAVKRSVWQTLRILEEITQLRRGIPKKIFVEVARTNRAEKKRTNSRQAKLLYLYKNIKDEARNWSKEIKETEAGKIQSKKLYLYYTQQGRCMYSGEPIDLGDLFTSKYDIDHIYPQSVTKDNSWDNLVLVKSILNREKTDNYPIEIETQKKCEGLWSRLLKYNLISEKKYERLIRTTPLTADELADFVSRQLVETNQAVKAVTNLLKRLYPDTTICYVKAENVSDFRQKNEFVKLRSLNAHHHAKDAYLNIVVGNVYHEKFTNNPRNFIKKARAEKKRPYNLSKMFDFLLKVGQRVIWNPDNSYPVVKKMMANNDVQVTKKLIEQKGALYDATIYKASVAKINSYEPLKRNNSVLADVKKYGGFTSIKIAYYSIFELYNKKNKEHEFQLLAMPILKINQLKSVDDYIAYASSVIDSNKYDVVRLVYRKLCIDSLVKINGFLYYIGGKTNNKVYINSATSLVLNAEIVKKLKVIETYLNRVQNDNKYEPNLEYINEENNIEIYNSLIEKMGKKAFSTMKMNKKDELSKLETLNAFKKIDLRKQCYILFELLNLLTHQKTTFDIKMIGLSASRCTINMNITKLQEFSIVTKSITGLYSKEIKII